MPKFSIQDLESVQRLAFPLISMISPIDPAEIIQSTGPALGATAGALEEAAELFRAAEAAVADGYLSAEELNTLVAEAGDMKEALAGIQGAVGELTN